MYLPPERLGDPKRETLRVVNLITFKYTNADSERWPEKADHDASLNYDQLIMTSKINIGNLRLFKCDFRLHEIL